MPPTEESTVRRVGADGETVEPQPPTDEVIVATIPGDDESKFITLTLANPLNERDKQYLGLPPESPAEVGQKVRVNKNGARAIINAGYATVDPEDNAAVRSVLRGETADAGEPTADPSQGEQAPEPEPDVPAGEPVVEPGQGDETVTNSLTDPPAARSTPATPGPGAPQPGQKVKDKASGDKPVDRASDSGNPGETGK